VLKAIIALVLALLVAAYTAFSQWERGNQYKDQARDAIAAQAATQARLTSMQAVLRKVNSDYATQELRLQQVHSTLTDRATDRDVYNVLCERANCVKLDSVPTPAD